MIQLIKSMRLKRLRGWRLVRLSGVVLVLVCLWAALTYPSNARSRAHTSRTHSDYSSVDYPALHFHAPFTTSGSDPDPAIFLSRPHARPHPLQEPSKIEVDEVAERNENEAGKTGSKASHDTNPRYNLQAGALDDIRPKLHRNRPFFQEKRLHIPEDYGERGESEYIHDDYGAGKRGYEEEKNMAIEEEDDEEGRQYEKDMAAEEKEYQEDKDKRGEKEEKNKVVEEDEYEVNKGGAKKKGRNEEEHDMAIEVDEQDEDKYIYDEEEEEKYEHNAALEEVDDTDTRKYDGDDPVVEDIGVQAQEGKIQNKSKAKKKVGDLAGDDVHLTIQENMKLDKHKAEKAIAKRKLADQELYLDQSLNFENNGDQDLKRQGSLKTGKDENIHKSKNYILEKSKLNMKKKDEKPNTRKKRTGTKVLDVGNDFGSVEQEMEELTARVREVCANYGLGPHALPGKSPALKHPPMPNYDIFYIDRADGLAWCPVYKAASTSWLYTFLTLAGVSETYVRNTRKQVSHVAREVWPALEYFEAEQAANKCLKFLIVRHPFERLVSAFRDKLENTNIGQEHGVEHFYQKYGKKIVAKYRKGGELGELPALRYSQDMDDPSIPKPKGTEPTFPEFIRYLIDTDLIYYSDDHWMPYYLHCTPCLVDYDVIAKFETLERDQNYVIHRAGLENKVKPSWKHLTKGRKTADTVKKYFATITKSELIKLFGKYKLDFELFGYSVDKYLDYVMSG